MHLRVIFLLTVAAITLGSGGEVKTIDSTRSSDGDEDPFEDVEQEIISFFEGFAGEDSTQAAEDDARSQGYGSNDVNNIDYEDEVVNFISKHDVTLDLPIGGSVKIDARNLNENELDFKLKLSENEIPEARKSKLKKILAPIVVFLLLKAMTLVPLAIGGLLLNAWNALQLSFFSIVISFGLAIFQLCKKIAENNAHAHIAGHGPWEAHSGLEHAARSLSNSEGKGHTIAYSAYTR